MASRTYDPSRATFYLDHSTLCDAFRAHTFGSTTPSDPAYRPLFGWIERVAAEANLCMSVMHLAQLGRWGDHSTADGVARWYERLPIVWVRGLTSVVELEEDYWTKRAAGISAPTPVQAFARSLLSAFDRIDRAAVSALLAAAQPIVALVDAARADTSSYRTHMHAVAAAFREDRAWADKHGWTEKKKAARTQSQKSEALRRCAREAHARLVETDDPEYRASACAVEELQGRLVELFAKEPTALPATRAMHAFDSGFVPFVVGKQPGSKSERDFLSGAFHDVVHLAVGAAYCDVFTCDARVSDFLGDLRSTLGRRRQLSVGRHPGGAAGFVGELVSTWP